MTLVRCYMRLQRGKMKRVDFIEFYLRSDGCLDELAELVRVVDPVVGWITDDRGSKWDVR